MPIIRVDPKGCVDSVYSRGGANPTDMASLSNLVPAPDTLNQWVPKPAASKFSGSTSQFVSAQIVIGSRLYGMRASLTFAGKDEPFCFDLLANSYVTISGITSGNTPTNAPSTGSWQPPHLEVIGVKVIVTHTGFSGTGANFFGVIDITTLSALTWTASNTATNALPSVPVWVTQFNQRAMFFCNPGGTTPAVLATDVLNPVSRSATVVSFILTFGDTVPLLCGGTLGLNNQLGGIVQSLMVFKTQTSNIFQVTGDFASAGSATLSAGSQPALTGQQLLTLNTLNVATGTVAPNSVTGTPKGLAFLAPDGWRIIDFAAEVSPPIGFAGTGITVPFTSSVQPTRVSAACNATTLRASTQNGSATNSPQQEWCYDLVRDCWYGPHTFPVSLINTYGNSFVITPTPTIGGFIWQSDLLPNSSSVYTENGASMTCIYQSALLPDRQSVDELSSHRGVFYQGYGAGNTTYSISAQDENANILAGGFVQLTYSTSAVLWGTFVWGSGQSLGGVSQIAGYGVSWTAPLVFDRMSIVISVTGAPGIRFGAFYLDIEQEGYTVGP